MPEKTHFLLFSLGLLVKFKACLPEVSISYRLCFEKEIKSLKIYFQFSMYRYFDREKDFFLPERQLSAIS